MEWKNIQKIYEMEKCNGNIEGNLSSKDTLKQQNDALML